MLLESEEIYHIEIASEATEDLQTLSLKFLEHGRLLDNLTKEAEIRR